MFNFKDFLNEKYIEVGKNLEDKLHKVSEPFAKKLLDFFNSDDIKDEFGYAKIDWDDKDSNLLTLIDDKGKQRKVKLGKLLKTIGFNKEYKEYEVENFIKSLKTEEGEFKVLKGEDIRWGYDCGNYAVRNEKSVSGGLDASCMRFARTQVYLDIYTENPNQVSLLVLMKDGEVDGRALIWTMDNDNKYMDRIYTNNKEDDVKFKTFADKNNFTDKTDTITLENDGEYDYYPYMDTFEFYYPEEGILSVQSDLYEPMLNLKNTDGSATDESNMVWSEYYSEMVNEDEVEYVGIGEGEMDYIYRHDLEKDYKDEWVFMNSNGFELNFGVYNAESVEGKNADIDECSIFYNGEIFLNNNETERFLYEYEYTFLNYNELLIYNDGYGEINCDMVSDENFVLFDFDDNEYDKPLYVKDTVYQILDENGEFHLTDEEPDYEEYTDLVGYTIYYDDNKILELISSQNYINIDFYVNNKFITDGVLNDKSPIYLNELTRYYEERTDDLIESIDGIMISKEWLDNPELKEFSNGDSVIVNTKHKNDDYDKIIEGVLGKGYDFKLKKKEFENAHRKSNVRYTQYRSSLERIYFEVDGIIVYPFRKVMDGNVVIKGELKDLTTEEVLALFDKNENIMSFDKFKLLK